jgi:hypothetical protein
MTIIKDGTGDGYLARVIDENQLLVRAVTEPDYVHSNHKYKQYYATISGTLTANSTNEHRILYIQSDDTALKMYIDAYIYGWNGGNTNHNRACRLKVYRDAGAPIANSTSATIGNLNWTSSNVALATAYKWDATATNGMTMSSNGILVYDNLLTQGLTELHLQGVPILGYGNTISISLTPEEIGAFAIVIRFFMKDDSKL